MLTKEEIQKLKNNSYEIETLIKSYKDSKSLTFILDSLGQLPPEFNGDFLIDLLDNKNSNVRLITAKTIGKLNNKEYLGILKKVALNDNDTKVRREAVSSIGRMRLKDAQDDLIDILKDHDPKIVCQAIRALLVFKGEDKVDKSLKSLINHDNEMVRSAINKAYYVSKESKTALKKHSEFPEYLRNVIVNGDTLEVMKLIEDESIHLTFTSPPYYNAKDYSIYPSYKHYLEFLSNVFKEVHRITKEGRFFILNTSPVIMPRISRAHSSRRYPIPFDIHPYLMDMGWEFIDDIIWLKPEASVKNRIGGFMQHRKPLGYKPNCTTEYLMVYRKSTDKLIDWNMKQYDEKIILESKVADGYETSNVWKIDPSSDRIHSAVFPVELCKKVIEYYSFKGDLVFDPFGGSGTLGKTAQLLDRSFFLTEQDPEYFAYMQNFEDDPKKKTKKKILRFNEISTTFLTLNKFEKWILQKK